jgi:hypothetical protein
MIKFDNARSKIMTQEWADELWIIACECRALVAGHTDEDKIKRLIRNHFERLDLKGMYIPEAGFSWRCL